MYWNHNSNDNCELVKNVPSWALKKGTVYGNYKHLRILSQNGPFEFLAMDFLEKPTKEN